MPVERAEVQAAFAHVLRESRKRAGLSQERLALVCGCDRAGLGRIERGQHLPSLPTLFALAEALDTTPDAILKRVRARLDHTPPKRRR